MPAFVYILHSATINKYYIGETEDIDIRLEQHTIKTFKGAFTKQSSDWELVWQLACINRSHARQIESFIKKMKSSQFILRLINTDSSWLIEKFPVND